MAAPDLDSLMRPEEADRIGVHAMTESQRQALTEGGRRLSSSRKGVVASIKAVKYGGRLIVLDDGSRWEVDEIDDGTAELWDTGARVVVLDGEMFLLEDLEKIGVQPDG